MGKQVLDSLDVRLPVDGAEASQKVPWLLHSMDVNALNFCAFALCSESGHQTAKKPNSNELLPASLEDNGSSLLIATPNALDSGGIDIFQLPTERRVATISSDKTMTTGMVMALRMLLHPENGRLIVISGYEDGQTVVHIRTHESPGPWLWRKVQLSKPHTQPLLSIDVSPRAEAYFTSSADAVIAKFGIPSFPPSPNVEDGLLKTLNTKHAGQQDLTVRSDGKIFATAGWDARIRVYSTKTMRELAVLKWHKQGCYAVAFAQVIEADTDTSELPSGKRRCRDTQRFRYYQEAARYQSPKDPLACSWWQGRKNLAMGCLLRVNSAIRTLMFISG